MFYLEVGGGAAGCGGAGGGRAEPEWVNGPGLLYLEAGGGCAGPEWVTVMPALPRG
jgi:hypothetical protein